MPGILMPPWLLPEKEIVVPMDDSTAVFEPAFARGNQQRQNYADPRPVVKRTYRGLNAIDRAAMLAFGWRLKGRFNKFFSPVGFTTRGGLGALCTELLSNNYFDNGTTGWTTVAANFTMTAHDRVLRFARVFNDGTDVNIVRNTNAMTLVQYAPYVLRVSIRPGSSSDDVLDFRAGSTANANDYASTGSVDNADLMKLAFVPFSTVGHISVRQGDVTSVATQFFGVDYISCARCALLDTGENLLLQSDAFQTTWVQTRVTVTANSQTAANGNAVADEILDTAVNNTHFIDQGVTVSSSSGLDYQFMVYLHAGTRTFARVLMVESTSSHECYIDVNLTSGATGTATASGANWTSPRAFVVDAGNGWWRVHIVGRKASAGTTITCRIHVCSALGTTSYLGNGTGIWAWRGTFAQSGVPSRQSVSSTSTSQFTTGLTGDTLHLKGLPASTTELLLPGDSICIDDEWHIVTSVLNSDAAGLGACKIEPALGTAKANNTPVEIYSPLPAWTLADDASYENLFGVYSDFELNMQACYE